MVLYLAAAVIGVAAIVFLVIHVAKGGSSTASGTSTPGATTTAGGGAAGQGFVLRQAAKVGKYPLNKTAVSQLSAGTKAATSTITSQMASTKSGKPGKSVVGIYDTGPTSSASSPDYKGLVFIGYDGTFNPAKLMNLAQKHLKSSRVVNPGPHGGKMVCGYDVSDGAASSECVWATTTTFGVVEYINHGKPAKVGARPGSPLR